MRTWTLSRGRINAITAMGAGLMFLCMAQTIGAAPPDEQSREVPAASSPAPVTPPSSDAQPAHPTGPADSKDPERDRRLAHARLLRCKQHPDRCRQKRANAAR